MTPGFTPEQRKVIGNYLRWVANHMNLRDWTLELMFDPPSNANAIAQVRPVYGRRIACVWLMRSFADMEPEKARHAIVHELVHVITNDITSLVENLSGKLLGESAFAVLWEATKERNELATDLIAELIAPHMPLIDWTLTDEEEAPGVSWVDEPSPQLGPLE